MGDLAVERALCSLLSALEQMGVEDRIDAINQVKLHLHAISPMKDEPVDCVVWVRSDQVQANDYNPNKVAPPEMRLLLRSIEADGYTQPIVTFEHEGVNEVVDGSHRFRVGTETPAIRNRIHGRLPVTIIRVDREGKADRIAATIRHNRARGKHLVSEMSNIVLELARRNWNDAKIAKELGMDPDEVLRLKQIGGLADLFADGEFSEAWEIEHETEASDV